MLKRRSSPHREGQLGTIPDDECFASIDHCSKCHHSLRHAERPQDHLGRCSEGLSPKPTQFPSETWVRLPKEVWPESWFDQNGRPLFRRPVIRLLRSFMAIQRLVLTGSASLSRSYLTWVQSRSQNFQAHTHFRLMDISPFSP